MELRIDNPDHAGTPGSERAGLPRPVPPFTAVQDAPMPASFRPGPVDAIAFLVADHERLKKLFKQFRFLCFTRASAKAEKVARLICNEWTMHTTVEEEIFYPEARAAIDNPQIIDDAEADRAMASELIAQIMGGSIVDRNFAARVGMLAEYVKHHVREEQVEVFPRVRQARLEM